MTERSGVAVIVRAVRDMANGETRTTYYGPFLPHAGSAVDQLISDVEAAANSSVFVRAVECAVEFLYIGEGESDAAVVAVR